MFPGATRHWRLIVGIVLIVFMALPASWPAHGQTTCVCPNVKARGVGDTSCSASEDHGFCTVDFNLFGPKREDRALALLRESGAEALRIPNPNAPSSDLPQADPTRLLDYVLIYLTVALGDQFAAAGPSDSGRAMLRSLVEAAHDRNSAFRDDVMAAFGPKAARHLPSLPPEVLQHQPPVEARRGEPVAGFRQVRFSPGCIEIVGTDGVWLMFKTNWSLARSLPRCGVVR